MDMDKGTPLGPSAYLPRMPNLWVIEVPNSTVLTLWGKHCILFKSLELHFPLCL